jgi:tRNA(Glu) U13 pseudouridine synthase TruD
MSSRRRGRLALQRMHMEIDKVVSAKAYIASSPNAGVVDVPDSDEEALLFTFTLPAGSYATSVLREFMKL